LIVLPCGEGFFPFLTFVSAPEYLDIPPNKYGKFKGQPGNWASFVGGSVLAKLSQAFEQENCLPRISWRKSPN
jgi:hypothetical protein